MVRSLTLEIMLGSITIMDTHALESMINMIVTTIDIDPISFVYIVCNMGMLGHFVILEIISMLILI